LTVHLLRCTPPPAMKWANMSEWFDIESKDDIEISEDGETLEILFNTNKFGNQYVEVPIEFITEILKGANLIG
jgi:hypothetical protein